MKHKNNWSHKNEYRNQRKIENDLKSIFKEKPMVSEKGVLWGTKK